MVPAAGDPGNWWASWSSTRHSVRSCTLQLPRSRLVAASRATFTTAMTLSSKSALTTMWDVLSFTSRISRWRVTCVNASGGTKILAPLGSFGLNPNRLSASRSCSNSGPSRRAEGSQLLLCESLRITMSMLSAFGASSARSSPWTSSGSGCEVQVLASSSSTRMGAGGSKCDGYSMWSSRSPMTSSYNWRAFSRPSLFPISPARWIFKSCRRVKISSTAPP
mmetsp:Transcript_11257/g.30637  ORF Transcript_11257/g.30637 Transcript_11257/m.30637 type:complete len:221 (-) Transcript_11257:463-1125(-)